VIDQDDVQLEPVEAMRFNVTGWGIDADDLQAVQAALAGRRWPWVKLLHMNHATGQEARVVETEDGYRLRFRRKALTVTVTVLPGTGAGVPVGWHSITDVADLERFGERVRTGRSDPAVVFQCAGCGQARRRGVTGDVLNAVEMWAASGFRGRAQLNLVPGHQRSRDPETIRARELRREQRRRS